MKLKPSEKHIKSVFENHERELDIDELWAGIEGKKKKRRPFFWWIGLGLGALIIIGAFFLIPNKDHLIDHQADELFNASANEHSMTARDEHHPIENSTKVNSIETIENLSSDAVVPANLDKPIVNQSKINLQLPVPSPSLSKTYENKLKRQKHYDTFINGTINSTPITTNFSLNKNEPKNMRAKKINQPFIKISSIYSGIPTLETSDSFVFPILNCFVTTNKEVINPTTNQWVWAAELGSSIGNGQKNLSHLDPLYERFANTKNTAENHHLHWSSSLMLTARKNKYSFGVGIKYLEILESFSYQNLQTTQYDSTGVVSIIVDENNNILETEVGTITVTKLSSYDFLRQNKYSYLQIPLEVSRVWKKDRLSFTLGLNAKASFSLSRNGEVLNSIESFEDLNNRVVSETFNNSPQIFLGIKPGVSYNLTDRTYLNFRPYVQRAINSSFRESSGIQEKPILYGAHFGIGIKL